MRPTWDPSGLCRSQVDPMSATWTLLSGKKCLLLCCELTQKNCGTPLRAVFTLSKASIIKIPEKEWEILLQLNIYIWNMFIFFIYHIWDTFVYMYIIDVYRYTVSACHVRVCVCDEAADQIFQSLLKTNENMPKAQTGLCRRQLAWYYELEISTCKHLLFHLLPLTLAIVCVGVCEYYSVQTHKELQPKQQTGFGFVIVGLFTMHTAFTESLST